MSSGDAPEVEQSSTKPSKAHGSSTKRQPEESTEQKPKKRRVKTAEELATVKGVDKKDAAKNQPEPEIDLERLRMIREMIHNPASLQYTFDELDKLVEEIDTNATGSSKF